MIDCNEILRSLDAYLDGELSVEDSRHFEDHVAACFPCHERQEFRRVLRQVVRIKLTRVDLPPGLAERIRGAIHSPEGS
ncbi:MAG TPA: zf-HC2 domain-containing protein [Actinomycetota bacterium]|nr:zf-HC2 domain-containing protein [Actinomycetota bacterium]